MNIGDSIAIAPFSLNLSQGTVADIMPEEGFMSLVFECHTPDADGVAFLQIPLKKEVDSSKIEKEAQESK